jgi:D-alanyl-D-alanine carboxypeptidase
MKTMPLVRRFTLLAILCAVGGAVWSTRHSVNAAPPDAGASLPVRFQAELDRLREANGLPGITAAYQLQDGTTQAFGSGFADRELDLPATAETRMMSGSTGKTFVGALAVTLAHDGKLGLDDPIQKWLGDEPWFARLPNARSITLRMLLNHSSGLRDHVFSEAFGTALLDLDPERKFAPAELIGFILDTEPLFAPGQGYSYSDTNFILAGLILERAGGAPYYEQIEHRFLYPLGLTQTAPSPGRIHPGLAQGYLDPKGPLTGLGATTLDRGVFRFDPGSEWTGGGLVTSPRDLVRWACALFGGRATSAQALAAMLGSVAPKSGEPGRNVGYGLGVGKGAGDFGPEYGHGGWFPGYRTSFAYYADHGVAVAVQTNGDAVPGERVHELRQTLARVILAR